MRSLARAGLVSAFIVAIGCGGGSSPGSTSSSKGVPGSRLTVTVRGETAYFDATAAATVFLPSGGLVTAPGGLRCGISGGVASTRCSGEFAWGAGGTPARVELTATPDAGDGYGYYAFAGDCTGGETCVVAGNADKMVAVRFARTKEGLRGHANFSDEAVHAPLYRGFAWGRSGALRCADCHGGDLQGRGIAVSCSGCHAWPIPPDPLTWDEDIWDEDLWR
jgi:hypothetical protein